MSVTTNPKFLFKGLYRGTPIRYDWWSLVTFSYPDGLVLNGYETEMMLQPIRIHPQTGQQALYPDGPKKGTPLGFSLEDIKAGNISLAYISPGDRVQVLLEMLSQNRLYGKALENTLALNALFYGYAIPSGAESSEALARFLLDQEYKKEI
jgi:hypothetical protein